MAKFLDENGLKHLVDLQNQIYVNSVNSNPEEPLNLLFYIQDIEKNGKNGYVLKQIHLMRKLYHSESLFRTENALKLYMAVLEENEMDVVELFRHMTVMHDFNTLGQMAASSTAMQAVAASSTAMQAVAASSTAMQAVIASSTAMQAVAASSTAMQAVIASSTAMQKICSSALALNRIVKNTTAKTALCSTAGTQNLMKYKQEVVSSLSNTQYFRQIQSLSDNKSGNGTTPTARSKANSIWYVYLFSWRDYSGSCRVKHGYNGNVIGVGNRQPNNNNLRDIQDVFIGIDGLTYDQYSNYIVCYDTGYEAI